MTNRLGVRVRAHGGISVSRESFELLAMYERVTGWTNYDSFRNRVAAAWTENRRLCVLKHSTAMGPHQGSRKKDH